MDGSVANNQYRLNRTASGPATRIPSLLRKRPPSGTPRFHRGRPRLSIAPRFPRRRGGRTPTPSEADANVVALDLHFVALHLDLLVEHRFARLDVVLPAVPRAGDHFALERTLAQRTA